MNRYSETVSDQIATLQTEIERDTATLLALAQTNHVQEERIAALEAENERLREACQKLVNAAYVMDGAAIICRVCHGRDYRLERVVHPAWCPVPTAQAALELTP